MSSLFQLPTFTDPGGYRGLQANAPPPLPGNRALGDSPWSAMPVPSGDYRRGQGQNGHTPMKGKRRVQSLTGMNPFLQESMVAMRLLFEGANASDPVLNGEQLVSHIIANRILLSVQASYMQSSGVGDELSFDDLETLGAKFASGLAIIGVVEHASKIGTRGWRGAQLNSTSGNDWSTEIVYEVGNVSNVGVHTLWGPVRRGAIVGFALLLVPRDEVPDRIIASKGGSLEQRLALPKYVWQLRAMTLDPGSFQPSPHELRTVTDRGYVLSGAFLTLGRVLSPAQVPYHGIPSVAGDASVMYDYARATSTEKYTIDIAITSSAGLGE